MDGTGSGTRSEAMHRLKPGSDGMSSNGQRHVVAAIKLFQLFGIPVTKSKHAMHGISRSVAAGYATQGATDSPNHRFAADQTLFVQGVHINQIAPGYIRR